MLITDGASSYITCPVRALLEGPKIRQMRDRWITRGPDHICSYCGSMEPEEFLDWCRRCIEPDSWVAIDPSEKTGKYYIHRRGIKDSTVGAVRFYAAHFDETDDEAVKCERHRIIGNAIEVSVPRLGI